jgi:hypothetical protein
MQSLCQFHCLHLYILFYRHLDLAPRQSVWIFLFRIKMRKIYNTFGWNFNDAVVRVLHSNIFFLFFLLFLFLIFIFFLSRLFLFFFFYRLLLLNMLIRFNHFTLLVWLFGFCFFLLIIWRGITAVIVFLRCRTDIWRTLMRLLFFLILFLSSFLSTRRYTFIYHLRMMIFNRFNLFFDFFWSIIIWKSLFFFFNDLTRISIIFFNHFLSKRESLTLKKLRCEWRIILVSFSDRIWLRGNKLINRILKSQK